MIASLLSKSDSNVAWTRTGFDWELTANEATSTVKTSEIWELLNFFISDAGEALDVCLVILRI
jgi:hypothetical protein